MDESEVAECLDLITDAAFGHSSSDDQQRIAQVGVRFLSLILKKNRDYGSSVFKTPMLTPNLDPGTAILVRMLDKIQRLFHNNTLEINESRDDTMMDLGAYALLYLARPGKEDNEHRDEKSKNSS